MAATEKVIKKLYYISTACFLVFGTIMIIFSETNKEVFEDAATYILMSEYAICVLLLVVYLCKLVRQIDQINHLNFITEKKVLYNTSFTFIVVMIARGIVKSTLTVKPSLLYDHGVLLAIIADLLATIFFELAPIAIIQI